jgi:deoxycytidylate deaminase
MKYLSGIEEKIALEFIQQTAVVASNSTCDRSHCGSLIVANNEVIGEGVNSPPRNLETQRRCSYEKDSYNKKVTDKTCCVHAEQRAIFDALARNPHKISGSRLYFVRTDEAGKPKRSGKPYCTMCSKTALDVGIAEFVLWHKEGVCVYSTQEYNDLSFKYSEKTK